MGFTAVVAAVGLPTRGSVGKEGILVLSCRGEGSTLQRRVGFDSAFLCKRTAYASPTTVALPPRRAMGVCGRSRLLPFGDALDGWSVGWRSPRVFRLREPGTEGRRREGAVLRQWDLQRRTRVPK